MKKFIVALIAFILAFSALCVVSSAADLPIDDAVVSSQPSTSDSDASGDFISSFLSGLTEVFSGITKGFAGVSVNAADSLILTSDGGLTSFAQLGIFGIGLALVAGVVGLLARRFRR